MISTSQLTVDMPGNKENAVVQSAPIEVEGSNLNEPIKLALGGANKDKFELSAQLLEPTGGVFNVRFSGKMGNYEAYVKLSSRGAADKYIFLFASVTQGVESLVIDADAHLTVTDLSGCHVRTLTGAALTRRWTICLRVPTSLPFQPKKARVLSKWQSKQSLLLENLNDEVSSYFITQKEAVS